MLLSLIDNQKKKKSYLIVYRYNSLRISIFFKENVLLKSMVSLNIIGRKLLV